MLNIVTLNYDNKHDPIQFWKKSYINWSSEYELSLHATLSAYPKTEKSGALDVDVSIHITCESTKKNFLSKTSYA